MKYHQKPQNGIGSKWQKKGKLLFCKLLVISIHLSKPNADKILKLPKKITFIQIREFLAIAGLSKGNNWHI